ncbi:short-chain dehydrogenase [Chlorobaculum limnaeum]|uniref:Short-chain dehydrogenase n=1 Tax=Chlorobaculum limnaeum TaxID=274537 RepID=A0A1D8D4F6_CHLLM|nr:SDR family oxidoreductase [Chlorobaculum limnaeum]AOS84077.1 short-chain dehydrogenase [Chlorobaculum limnaeum]
MKHVILITGAGKGIGRAIALEFARAIRHHPDFEPVLVLSSRTPADLEAISLECRAEGALTDTVTADISDMADVRRLANHIVEHYGRIDCLVNNAGVGRFGMLGDMTEEDFDYTMSTNLKGTFFLTQALFAMMQRQRSGHIFFITSVAATKAFEHSSIYCMSKFGQRGLVETLRLYARKSNVRITDVQPGAALTPMWGEVNDEIQSLMMMPEDVAAPVVQAYLQPARTVVEEIVLRPTGGDLQDE